jgi:hypothetical protein
VPGSEKGMFSNPVPFSALYINLPANKHRTFSTKVPVCAIKLPAHAIKVPVCATKPHIYAIKVPFCATSAHDYSNKHPGFSNYFRTFTIKGLTYTGKIP